MQLLESVSLALSAIWASKLRSFMTVLGNIVAVSSIVTVVSLIQGMNAMVSDAIVSDFGADSFTISRLPRGVITAEADHGFVRGSRLRIHSQPALRYPSPACCARRASCRF